MKVNVATIFDKNYIVRTLAFYNAFLNTGADIHFWFLCLDQETKDIMSELKLPNTSLVSIPEMKDTELEATRSNRSVAEFAFTTKSAFVKFIADKLPDGENLIFADNDVIYFQSPEGLFGKMRANGQTIGISPHHFPPSKIEMNEKVGKYNAGLLYFILDSNSRQCIADWRNDCIEWCYLIYEKERFGDQKYIMKWPARYPGVYEITEKGINTGSWNINNWVISKDKNGNFYIDKDLLICYHFHRIKFYIDGDQIKPLPIYVFREDLYKIYSDLLETGWKRMVALKGSWVYGFIDKPILARLIKQKITVFIRNLKGVVIEE
jgi:hypothetical protein